MTTHSSILGWITPWTEEPGGLQSTVSQRVRHNCSDLACTQRKSGISSWLTQHFLVSEDMRVWAHWNITLTCTLDIKGQYLFFLILSFLEYTVGSGHSGLLAATSFVYWYSRQHFSFTHYFSSEITIFYRMSSVFFVLMCSGVYIIPMYFIPTSVSWTLRRLKIHLNVVSSHIKQFHPLLPICLQTAMLNCLSLLYKTRKFQSFHYHTLVFASPYGLMTKLSSHLNQSCSIFRQL